MPEINLFHRVPYVPFPSFLSQQKEADYNDCMSFLGHIEEHEKDADKVDQVLDALLTPGKVAPSFQERVRKIQSMIQHPEAWCIQGQEQRFKEMVSGNVSLKIVRLSLDRDINHRCVQAIVNVSAFIGRCLTKIFKD